MENKKIILFIVLVSAFVLLAGTAVKAVGMPGSAACQISGGCTASHDGFSHWITSFFDPFLGGFVLGFVWWHVGALAALAGAF